MLPFAEAVYNYLSGAVCCAVAEQPACELLIMVMVRRIPMIAITIMSSISVKSFCLPESLHDELSPFVFGIRYSHPTRSRNLDSIR
jgi:hypothetical protein